MNIKGFFSNWIVRNLLLAALAVLLFVLAANLFLSLVTQHGKEIIVPDFTNLTVQEASRVAASSGVEVVVVDSMYIKRLKPGAVYMQTPKAGEHVKEGRKIRLSVNTLKPKMVSMPSLVGISLRQAKAELQRNGLVLGKLVYVRDLATNNVISQQRFGRELLPGTPVPSGATINLVLGLSETDEMTFIPDLIGRRYQQAVDAVQESSLNIGSLVFDSSVTNYADSLNAFVYSQSPESHIQLINPETGRDSLVANAQRRGTEVSLYLTIDGNKLPAED